MPLKISNRELRRALLSLNGLSPPSRDDALPGPTGTSGPAWAHGMIKRLGFVQVDSVFAIERAQHHILFSRSAGYRMEHLKQLLERDRKVFENWSHDAAILPVECYPYWKHYFERQRNFEVHAGYRRYFAPVTPKHTNTVIREITNHGPLKPSDLNTTKVIWNDKYFAKPTLAKIAMEFLWRTGELAIARRDGQTKVYDLAQRVIPHAHYTKQVSREKYIDWACHEALKRLGVGTPRQIAQFFDAVSRKDAEAWCERKRGKMVQEVEWEHADGFTRSRAFALTSLMDSLKGVPAPPKSLRLINPFDPLIHDRQRTLRVFGFDYAIEIWVPPKKRKYGYYVLPILEGERFTGRVDAKADRKESELKVLGVWWESGVKPTKSRKQQLERELRKLARFADVADVVFTKGYLKT